MTLDAGRAAAKCGRTDTHPSTASALTVIRAVEPASGGAVLVWSRSPRPNATAEWHERKGRIMNKLSDRRAVLAASTMAVVALAATAWTATVVSIPRGFVAGCALSSLAAAWFAFWRPRITAPVAGVLASLSLVVMRRAYYGQPGFLSVTSLQSIAIWTFTFAAAVLLRFTLSRAWRTSGKGT